jgi:hypothetical protein
MAFTTQRYLINNLVNADNITASSQGAGTIRQPKKTGTGTATMTPSGSYTGASNLLYTVQCDGAGTVDSTATIRWKTSATAAGTWEASGVSATSSPITLSNGVSIQFSAGTLVLNDKWQFPVYAEYGPGKLFLNDRDAFWKSESWENLITNPDFTSNTTGWTATNCTLASIAGGQSGNCLEITRTGGSYQQAKQNITTVVGNKYLAKVYIKSGTSGNEQAILEAWTASGASDTRQTTSGSWVQIELEWIALETTTTIILYKNSATAGTMLFDTCEIYEIPTLTIDLGSAQNFTAIALLDFNASASAVYKVYANSSDSWASPAYTLNLTESSDPIIEYVDQTYQYVRYEFRDETNSDGFVSVGGLYAGTYSELTGNLKNIPWGSSKADALQFLRNVAESGKANSYVYARFVPFVTQYFPTRTSGDLATLEAVWEATFNIATGQRISILIHYFHDESTTLYLCECRSNRFNIEYTNYAHYTVELAWEQERITRTI